MPLIEEISDDNVNSITECNKENIQEMKTSNEATSVKISIVNEDNEIPAVKQDVAILKSNVYSGLIILRNTIISSWTQI